MNKIYALLADVFTVCTLIAFYVGEPLAATIAMTIAMTFAIVAAFKP